MEGKFRSPGGQRAWAGTARAALIYQHASADRDRLIADALSGLVKKGRKATKGTTEDPPRRGRGHAELITAPGTTTGQVEETSSDLALRTSERVTGIEPA
ncbi:hypothetical protein [Streptomyces sp. NPDC090036]|uniref:hypothetical protein n=1 Tax=Streptomyces sp. NPDC090036 TaxID=3365926 RepID=UPI003808915C